MLNLKEVDAYLDELRPFGPGPFEWRPGQKKAIIDLLVALDRYKRQEVGAQKVAELSAPTSAGKSVILWAFSMAAIHFKLLERSVITTPQKMLVKQYEKEKGWFDGVVLGRANYPCALFPSLKADACACRSPKARDKHPECNNCEYEFAKARFNEAKIGLTTMAYYMTGYSPHKRGLPGMQEPDSECVVIDESSNLEGDLLDRFALKIPDSRTVPGLKEFYVERGDKVDFNFDTQDSDKLTELVARYVMILEGDIKNLNEMLHEAEEAEDTRAIKEISKELNFREREEFKCQKILYYLSVKEPYYVNEDKQFKLIFGTKPFEKRLKQVSFMVLASGTPTTHLLTKDFTRVEMPHPIPVDRRKFIIKGIGQMNLKARAKTIPIIAKEVAELHSQHAAGRNTIVHCHSYKIAKDLYFSLRRCTRAKIVCQEKAATKEDDIAKWMATPDCIFLSVACNEGLNLIGDKFPLNIIIKVPFAYLGDGWVRARSTLDNDEYSTTESAVAIQQAAGRTTRAPSDYSITYMLDSDINWWLKKNEQYFEPWFLESVARA